MKWFIVIISFAICQSALTQEVPQAIWDQVELYLEDREDNVDLSVLFDRYKIYYESPLDINDVSYDDLLDLGLLSDIQIDELIHHRTKYGDLLMLEELQAVPSFQVSDIQRIKPFLKVNDTAKLPVSIVDMVSKSSHEVFLKWGRTLEQRAGYVGNADDPPSYLGDANRLSLRYRANYENKLRFGIITEKDEGEQLLSDTIYSGLDYLTAHLHLRDYSTLVKDVTIGDFSVSLGQGLITHNGFRSGKSAFVTAIKKGGRTLRPYTSVTENGFQRGAGVTLRPIKDVEVTLFGSSVRRDGNIRIDTIDADTPDLFLSSLQTSGQHRTLSEKEDKESVGVRSLGGRLSYFGKSYDVSVNHMSNYLDTPIIRSDDLSNLFRFGGEELHNTSIDYSYMHRNLHLFGESAYSSTGGLAHVVGALIGLDNRMSASLLWRDYDRDYNGIAPNAFGESSLVNNEQGLYIGFEILINRRWQLRTYADVWRHPWVRSRVANPSDGKEYLVRLDYKIKRKLNLYAQYFFEEKLENLTLDESLRDASEPTSNITVGRLQKRHKLRLHLSHKVNKFLELRSRVEFASTINDNGVSNGYLVFQDILYKPWDSPISFTGRIAFFDTDDSRSRIFAYENNILYEFGIPSFADRGVRYYLNVKYRVSRKLTAEFRWARTIKDKGTHGSGNEAIEGENRTDVRAQLRYRF